MFTDVGVRGTKHGTTRWFSRPFDSAWWFLPSSKSENVFNARPYSVKSDFVQGQQAQSFLRKAHRLGDQFFFRSSFLSSIPFLPNLLPVFSRPASDRRKGLWAWNRLRAQADSQNVFSDGKNGKVRVLQLAKQNDVKKGGKKGQKEVDYGWWAQPEQGNADLASLRYAPEEPKSAPWWNFFSWDLE